jgi:flagellar FliL protein
MLTGRLFGRAQSFGENMAEDLEEDFDETETSDAMDTAHGGGGGGGGGGKKKLILILVPLLLIVGAAAGAYFTGFADPLLKMFHKDKSAAPAEEATTKPGQPEPAAVFYDLPEILVNLNSSGRKQNFLKIRISLELESALDVTKIESVMPRIIDNFQVYLRELRLEDLQGSAGLLRLREELLARVNSSVKPAKVNDVLFKEMLVQ